MEYLFLYRRISDIDHIVPIIYSLLKNGINPKKIKYTDYLIDKSVINIKNDERIKFLINQNINFSQSNLIKTYKFENFYKNKNSFFKFFFKTTNFLINKFIKIFFFFKLLIIVLPSIKRKTIIVDDILYNSIKLLSFIFNVNLYSVPHGIVLHNGDLKNNNNENYKHLLPNLDNFRYFKKFFFYNNISLDIKKKLYKNFKIIGSARYCHEWYYKQKEIYPKINNLFDNNNTNILLLIEKNSFFMKNGEKIYTINEEKMQEVIDYIINNKNYNLIIKSHPSEKIKKINLVKNKNLLIINTDEQFKTFQLVDYVDVVIGFKTGAICDALIQRKFFLLLDYCHVYEFIIKDMLNSFNFAASFNDFVNKLDNFNNYKVNYDNFLQNYLNLKRNNILDEYYRNIVS